MPENTLQDRIANVRRFNRFITRKLGVLREGLLHSPYSPTESRIIYEIGTHKDLIAPTWQRNWDCTPDISAGFWTDYSSKDSLKRFVQKRMPARGFYTLHRMGTGRSISWTTVRATRYQTY